MDENILFFELVFYFNIFKKSGHVRYCQMEMIFHLILSAGLEVKLSGGFRYFYIRLEHRKI
jgi:hypothetical protein